MFIIPQDHLRGRYHKIPTETGITMTYVDRDESRLQVTKGPSAFECFWTPGQYFCDCLTRLQSMNFLGFKEHSFNAELSDGRKIVTHDWQSALKEVSDLPDEDFRYVELSASNGRSILISSISADRRLDIGVRAELEALRSLKLAMELTSPPRTVRLAWNHMTKDLMCNAFWLPV